MNLNVTCRIGLLSIIIFICVSCSILEPVLGVCNGETRPLENLAWLKEIVGQNKKYILFITEVEAKQYIYEDSAQVDLSEKFYGYQIVYKQSFFDESDMFSVTCTNIHSYDCQGNLLDCGCSSMFSYYDEFECCNIYVYDVHSNVIYEALSPRSEWILKRYYGRKE